MWQFIREWQFPDNDQPLRLVAFENMLYPQYEHHFMTITREAWKWLQDKAQSKLHLDLHPNVREHMQAIVDGVVPFGYRVE